VIAHDGLHGERATGCAQCAKVTFHHTFSPAYTWQDQRSRLIAACASDTLNPSNLTFLSLFHYFLLGVFSKPFISQNAMPSFLTSTPRNNHSKVCFLLHYRLHFIIPRLLVCFNSFWDCLGFLHFMIFVLRFRASLFFECSEVHHFCSLNFAFFFFFSLSSFNSSS